MIVFVVATEAMVARGDTAFMQKKRPAKRILPYKCQGVAFPVYGDNFVNLVNSANCFCIF